MSSKYRRLKGKTIFFCDHCDEELSRSSYWKHRRLYYDSTTNTWTKKDEPPRKARKNSDTKLSCGRDDENEPFVWSDDSSSSAGEEVLDQDPSDQDVDKNQEEFIPEEYECNHDNEDDVQVSSEDNESDCEEPLMWDDDNVIRDILQNEEPLPEPARKLSVSQTVNSLVSWLLYFLLLWQTTCKISDNGLEWLLRFMFQFLHTVGITTNNEYLVEMAVIFPSSLYLLCKFVKLDRDSFTKFAVCPKCMALYHLDDCTVRCRDRIEAKTCTNKPFKKGRQKECGAVLAKKYVTASKQVLFYPYKIYCFNSIISQLEELLKRPGMEELCEKWRKRKIDDGFMADIYDGKIWKDFQVVNGKDFLKSPRNIALGINVDWFQPYKRRKDRSVGVIYFVLLNLPREERFKWENVLIAGIIPELKKEPKSLNSFLNPIVAELNALWKGVKLQTSTSNAPLVHRAALIMASSDIPASRKLCGFKGHSAHRACSKCFKFFPGSFGEKSDFSGFDINNWPLRDATTHRINAEKVKNALNKTQHELLAKKLGVYYSSLLKLEYFDAVRFTVIDPMHNLFLGTAKKFFKLLISEDVLDRKKLLKLEEKINSMDVPTGYGRLPHRIASNFGCYTASQWKNWTFIYSMYCLHGLIPEPYLKCWQTFVLACQYMAKTVISTNDILRAGGLFVKFGQEFETTFGKEKVTINIHLHCHLKDCVLDYGPVHAFWCFSFERFNGILGSTPTNGRSIEVQLMRKLFVGKFVWNTAKPSQFKDDFMPFFQEFVEDSLENVSAVNALFFSKSATSFNLSQVDWSDLSLVNLPKSYKCMVIDGDDKNLLLNCYKALYPTTNIYLQSLSNVARKYAHISLGSERFGSTAESRSSRSARVMASWTSDSGSIEPSIFPRPGLVKFYMLHSITINGKTKQHVIACVSWYYSHPNIDKYGKPAQVWREDKMVAPGSSLYMPAQRIWNTYTVCKVKCSGMESLVVAPIPRLFC